MKNKNEIIKNHLNFISFKQNLSNQQKNLIQFYNNINPINKILIEKDKNYTNEQFYSTKNQIDNHEDFSKCANIFNIRLAQTRENLIELSEKKWPNINICKNILELKGNVKIKINII